MYNVDAEFLKIDEKSTLQMFQSLMPLIESLSPIERLEIREQIQNIILSELRSRQTHIIVIYYR